MPLFCLVFLGCTQNMLRVVVVAMRITETPDPPADATALLAAVNPDISGLS